MHVHLNIGSNLGDREDNIRRAVASLRQLASDISTVRVSDPMVSPPWGYESSNEFLNVGMSFDTDLTPGSLLEATQHIQHSISAASHRDPATGAYIDRLIDIDIIACTDPHSPDDCLSTISRHHVDAELQSSIAHRPDPIPRGQKLIEITTPDLTLPHPRALQRDFVLTPLRQIDLTLYTLLTETK